MNVKEIKKLFKENHKKESDLSAEQKAHIKQLLEKSLKNKNRIDNELSKYIREKFS